MADRRLYDDPSLKMPEEMEVDEDIKKMMDETIKRALGSLGQVATNLERWSDDVKKTIKRSKRTEKLFDRMLTELVVIRTQVVEMNEREKLREFRADAMEAPEPNLKKG